MVSISTIFNSLMHHYDGKPVNFSYVAATSQLLVNGKVIMEDFNQKFINDSEEQFIELDGNPAEFQRYLTDFIIGEIDTAFSEIVESEELSSFDLPAFDDKLKDLVEKIENDPRILSMVLDSNGNPITSLPPTTGSGN